MEFTKLHLGLVLVIVGVAGEGVEIIWKLLIRKRSEKLDLFLDSIGAFFWIVLVIGLALEIPDAARTDKEAAESNKLAGQANERAANTESNNLVLQAKLQPRIITPKNVEDFIFLTERITKKIPITVHAASYGDDTMSFAFQIRDMLNKAKFLPDSANGGVKIDGVGNSEFTYRWRLIGDTNEWPEVFFHFGTTNGIVNFTTSPEELINGFARPVTSEENSLLIYQAIKTCMDQIKIKTEWSIINDPNAVAPGECEIYIPAKNN
jgi:hypothetical protein